MVKEAPSPSVLLELLFPFDLSTVPACLMTGGSLAAHQRMSEGGLLKGSFDVFLLFLFLCLFLFKKLMSFWFDCCTDVIFVRDWFWMSTLDSWAYFMITASVLNLMVHGKQKKLISLRSSSDCGGLGTGAPHGHWMSSRCQCVSNIFLDCWRWRMANRSSRRC